MCKGGRSRDCRENWHAVLVKVTIGTEPDTQSHYITIGKKSVQSFVYLYFLMDINHFFYFLYC